MSIAAAGVHEAMDCALKKSLFPSVAMTPAPSGSLPYDRLSPVSHRLLDRPRTFHLDRMLRPVSMEPWTAIKKALPQCGGDTSSCLGTYPTAACSELHIGCPWTVIKKGFTPVW